MLITNTKDHLDLSNRTSFFHDNVVMMEIDNMLAGWPTYTLSFTAERPGLLDAVEFNMVEDKDSNDNTDGQAVKSESQAVDEDIDATLVCDPIQEPKDLDMPQCISVKPVALHVIPKNPPSIVRIRKKFQHDQGYTWPPYHRFREGSSRTWITQIDALMTMPAPVEASKFE
ncbi:hypothetical protein BDR07DRAFT_1379795 [Suillus spraguei]|nr:hypothetical protein BDR07DRAFT_1379795 [Suillus spraguei]